MYFRAQAVDTKHAMCVQLYTNMAGTNLASTNLHHTHIVLAGKHFSNFCCKYKHDYFYYYYFLYDHYCYYCYCLAAGRSLRAASNAVVYLRKDIEDDAAAREASHEQG